MMFRSLLLNTPDAMRRGGLVVLLSAVAALLYLIGISPAWIGKLMPSLEGWVTDNPANARSTGRCRS